MESVWVTIVQVASVLVVVSRWQNDRDVKVPRWQSACDAKIKSLGENSRVVCKSFLRFFLTPVKRTSANVMMSKQMMPYRNSKPRFNVADIAKPLSNWERSYCKFWHLFFPPVVMKTSRECDLSANGAWLLYSIIWQWGLGMEIRLNCVQDYRVLTVELTPIMCLVLSAMCIGTVLYTHHKWMFPPVIYTCNEFFYKFQQYWAVGLLFIRHT